MKKRIARTLFLIGVGALAWFAADRKSRLKRDSERKRKIMAANRSPEPGDILLFYRPGVFADVFIQTMTGSRVYHTALFMESTDDGPIVLEALTSGVQISNLRHTGREGDFVAVPAPLGKGARALEWALTKVGSPYDYRDGFVIGLEQIFKRLRVNYTLPGKYTCSELVAAAYEQSGVDLVPNKQPNETSPGDISASPFAITAAGQVARG